MILLYKGFFNTKNKPPSQCILGAFFCGVKWPGCEADLSPPYSGEVENERSHVPIPPTRIHGVCG